MNDRVKELRKNLGLNQSDFGSRLGVTTSSISKIEKGINNLTEQMIVSICREFSVNDEWLRTGKGEMFSLPNSNIISNLADIVQLDKLDKIIIQSYLDLNVEQRKAFKDYLLKLAEQAGQDKQ